MKFSINYQTLSNSVEKNFYKLSDVKDRLEKVAFDIVRFKESDPEELWQIQSADDGDYIVARYELDAAKEEVKTASWDVIVASGDINFYYKGDPIIRLAANKLGIGIEDLKTVKTLLPNKLSSNKELVRALLNNLNTTAKHELFKKYPELS